MMNIKDAKKLLKKTGTSKATGDAVRFMFANLIAFEIGLSIAGNSTDWPIPEIYADLGKYPEDELLNGRKEVRAKWLA